MTDDRDLFELDDGESVLRFSLLEMQGTIVVACAGPAARREARAAFDDIRKRLAQLDRFFSPTCLDGDIGRINNARGEAVAVSPETAQAIEAALGWCTLSQGMLDITRGGVIALWDFDRAIVPSAEALDNALAHVDFRHVRLDAQDTPHVQLADPESTLDLGNLAIGYAVDDLAGFLCTRGMADMRIQLGNTVTARGRRPDDSPWTVDLHNPTKPDTVFAHLPLDGTSTFAHSLYERSFAKGGTFYHDVLGTGDGRPVPTDLDSVTVIAESALDCNACGELAFPLGVAGARELADSIPGIEMLLVASDGSLAASHGIRL